MPFSAGAESLQSEIRCPRGSGCLSRQQCFSVTGAGQVGFMVQCHGFVSCVSCPATTVRIGQEYGTQEEPSVKLRQRPSLLNLGLHPYPRPGASCPCASLALTHSSSLQVHGCRGENPRLRPQTPPGPGAHRPQTRRVLG